VIKKLHIAAILVFLALSFGTALAYYLFFTSGGSAFITRAAISRYAESGYIDLGGMDGNLYDTTTFRDLELKEIKGLPPGSVLRIQNMEARVTSLSLNGLELKIHNARLEMPLSGTAVFAGGLKNGALDFNIYSAFADLKEIAGLFSENKFIVKSSGLFTGLDCLIKGTLSEPEASGMVTIKDLSHNGLSLSDIPLSFDLYLKNLEDEPELRGEIALDGGMITRGATAVKIQKSRISFSKDPKDPLFDISAASNIEGAKISISLKGSASTPVLKLTSEPALPQEMLLVMLATGKSWKGTEAALAKGEASPEIVKDFVDYFVFAGTGNKVAKRFGISELSLKYDDKSKGMGVTKSVSDRAEVSYSVEQPNVKANEDPKPATHTVGSKINVTGNISIEGDKELKQRQDTKVEDAPIAEGKVLLKYKKQF